MNRDGKKKKEREDKPVMDLAWQKQNKKQKQKKMQPDKDLERQKNQIRI
jgi:hypothetical protein